MCFPEKTFASDKFIGFSLRIRPPLIGNDFSLSFFKRAFKYEKRRYFKRGSPASDEIVNVRNILKEDF